MSPAYVATPGMLANEVRPLVLGADSDLVAVPRGTLTAIYQHLEEWAAKGGEVTDRAREYPEAGI